MLKIINIEKNRMKYIKMLKELPMSGKIVRD